MSIYYVVRPIKPTPDQEYRHGYSVMSASDIEIGKYDIMGEYDSKEKAESVAALCTTTACHLVGKDDYAEAVDSQCACNLEALVRSFERVITKLQYESSIFNRSTDWINEHPIVRLYAEQFSHLSHRCDWQDAYDYCMKRK